MNLQREVVEAGLVLGIGSIDVGAEIAAEKASGSDTIVGLTSAHSASAPRIVLHQPVGMEVVSVGDLR